LEYCSTIHKDTETIAVIGIGGSSLGAKAVYEFMRPVKDLSRKLYFFESTDPINITELPKINSIECYITPKFLLMLMQCGNETFYA